MNYKSIVSPHIFPRNPSKHLRAVNAEERVKESTLPERKKDQVNKHQVMTTQSLVNKNKWKIVASQGYSSKQNTLHIKKKNYRQI